MADENTVPPGPAPRRGNVLVTGGAGYIGSQTCKALQRRGYCPVVFDNLTYGHVSFVKWGPFINGDLEDRSRIRDALERFPVVGVIHFAAFAYVGESVEKPQKYYLNNLRNTLNLLEVMLEFRVGKLIFSSTCATYGDPVEIPIPETHPQNPVNPYGRTKLMVENILADYDRAYGLKSVFLRYFNAAGGDPDAEIGEWHDPETHLIPLALDVAAGKSPRIGILGTDYDTPDGTCVRDYIHVADLADAHVLALEHLLRHGKSDVFNLGNGNGFSVRDVIGTVERVTGRTVPATEEPRRPGDPPTLIGSAGKIRQVLEWQPAIPDLAEIIETAWRWYGKIPGDG